MWRWEWSFLGHLEHSEPGRVGYREYATASAALKKFDEANRRCLLGNDYLLIWNDRRIAKLTRKGFKDRFDILFLWED